MSLSEKPEKATGSKAGLETDYQVTALGQLQSETLHLWFVSEILFRKGVVAWSVLLSMFLVATAIPISLRMP